MKNLIFILAICTSTILFSQLSGEAFYTTKINMHKNLPEGGRGDMLREFMPEFMELKNNLLFNNEETLYQNVEEEETAEANFGDEGHGPKFMVKRMAPPEDVIYTNTTTKQVIKKKEFMDKIFLIKDSIHVDKWKLTGEMKEVSGMNCMKAEFIPEEGDSSKVVAWFTPEIPISSGPAGYGGLPGLIVHLNINEGHTEITLSNIVMRSLEKDEISKPKKGKVVTEEEYTEMVKKKMEQMKKQWEGHGGGPGHIMITK